LAVAIPGALAAAGGVRGGADPSEAVFVRIATGSTAVATAIFGPLDGMAIYP
jgi:hypothetical protein